MSDSINEVMARFSSLTPQEWNSLAEKLQDNPGYKDGQTEENLHIILGSLGVSLPITDDTRIELLMGEGKFRGVPCDLLYALSSYQKDWFDKLIPQLEIKGKGRERPV